MNAIPVVWNLPAHTHTVTKTCAFSFRNRLKILPKTQAGNKSPYVEES